MARARTSGDIFGDDPFGLTGRVPALSGGDAYVAPPRLPQVQTGPSTGGTGTRTIPSPVPAPDVPDTTPQTAATAFSQPALWSYLQGYPHTPAGLQAAYAANPAIFGGATIIGSKGDKLQLPTGQVVDVIQSAGTGGNAWQWLEGGGQSAGGLNQYFTDPTQQFLLGGVDARLAQIQSLLQNRPSLDPVGGLVNQAVGQWAGPQVQPAAYQSAISALSRALGQPMPENAQLPQVTQNLRERVGQLRAAPYSQGDEAALRAKAFDQLEQDRTAAKARILEELGAKGHAATSGTVARALQEVDQAFDKMRASNTNQMALSEMQLRESRGGAADQLEMALAQLGGIDQQAKVAWTQQQLQSGMSAAGLEMAWQQEVQRRMAAALQATQTLHGLQTSDWAAQNLLGNEAYQVSQDPYRMALTSMAAANNTLTGQPNIQQILSNLSGLSGQQQYQNQMNTQNWGTFLQGLATFLNAAGR